MCIVMIEKCYDWQIHLDWFSFIVYVYEFIVLTNYTKTFSNVCVRNSGLKQ